MELQLGLAPPSNNPVKGFDLNNHVYEPKGTVENNNKKRGYDEAFDEFEQSEALVQTLPLFLWNRRPNDDDDGQNSSSYTITKDDGEESCIVGWPPIKSWMKKMNSQHHEERVENGNSITGLKSSYVKVKMEGMAIARKVDLSLYHSYQTLSNTLITMFGKWFLFENTDQKSLEGLQGGRHYTLTYQDREGDWLLAGDVPWQTFIRTVQRLKIITSVG